jgi:hypothetical protein
MECRRFLEYIATQLRRSSNVSETGKELRPVPKFGYGIPNPSLVIQAKLYLIEDLFEVLKKRFIRVSLHACY